jgi:hypothetical protein
MADGRMWDEMTTPVESSADVEDSFRVYLPVQL